MNLEANERGHWNAPMSGMDNTCHLLALIWGMIFKMIANSSNALEEKSKDIIHCQCTLEQFTLLSPTTTTKKPSSLCSDTSPPDLISV